MPLGQCWAIIRLEHLFIKDETMNKDTALKVAGTIFALFALIHLLRLILGWDFILAGYMFPMFVSVLGFIVGLGLSIWMFSASRRVSKAKKNK